MKNILICSAGRRVSLVKAFQKELNLLLPDSKVFCTDSNPSLSAACQVADCFFLVSKITEPNYISALLEICLKNEVGMLIPTIDTELELLSENIHTFQRHGIHIIISTSDFIKTCRDKRKTNDFFQKLGINIPKSISKENLTFPFFIKPYNGSLSAEIHIIKQASDLTEYLLSDPKFMFMEYLSPEIHEEYTVDIYYDKQNLLKCAIPRKRIEVRGGEISKGITKKNEIINLINNKLRHIEGARGCITAQFFMNTKTKQIYGIEINPRFGGGFPLSYESGGNYPKMLIQEYLLDKTIGFFENWKEETLMLRYDAEIILNG